MTDDVQREIEANEARARDTEDVGLDEDFVNARDSDDDTFLENAIDSIFDRDNDAPDEQSHEYDDNTKTTPDQ